MGVFRVDHAFLVLLCWRLPMALMVLAPAVPLRGHGGSLRLLFSSSPCFAFAAAAVPFSPPVGAPLSGSSATDGVLFEWDRLSLVSSRGVGAAGEPLLISRKVMPFSAPPPASSSSSWAFLAVS